jgi:chemotaxis protein histidine kinase CheA
MADIVITEADKSVAITTDGKTETFSMTVIPPVDSMLVKAGRKQILINLDLEALILDLSRTGRLLFLAYCGVAGFAPLRNAITVMQDKLMVLCGDCELALNGFALASEQVLGTLKRVFSFLLKGKEDWALNELSACGEQATAMAAKASSLADRFEKLGDGAMATLGDTTIQQGLSQDKVAALKTKLEELEVESKKATKLKQLLETARIEMESLYQEAKAEASKESDRAFAIALTGAIMGPIGAGLGAYAGSTQKNNVAVPPPPPAPEPVKADAANSAEIKKLKEEERKKQEDSQKEEKERAVIAQAYIKDLEAKSDTEEKKQAAAAAKREETLKQEAALKAEENRKAAAIEALGKAMEAAQKSANQMAETSAKAASDYNAQKMVFLKQKLEIQAQERENLLKLEVYATQMTQAGNAKAIENRIVESLSQAIGALRNIVGILRTNAKFWTQMAEACGRLGNTGSSTTQLRSDIQRYRNEPDRLSYYVEADFKEQVVRYYANWRALQAVSAEYCTVASRVGEEIRDDFRKNPNNDESRQWAVGLSKGIVASVSKQISEKDAQSKAYDEALREVPVQLSATA